jgi:N-acetylated-alpha-linked acidic dipeptidase
LQKTRETTEVENEIIRSGGYILGNDPEKNLIPPAEKSIVPFLDFSPLQNALTKLKKSADSLQAVFEDKVESAKVSKEFNEALYTAEQQLLTEAGLPRRQWYKHTLYAPGFYTGYGVKTMPGIREAIEERKWQEAQEQIEVVAKTLNKLADYFKVISTS